MSLRSFLLRTFNDSLSFNLTVPKVPTGFGVDVRVDSTKRVDAIGTLAIAVEAMYLLTLLPYEAALREDYLVSRTGIEEEVLFEPLAAEHADDQMEPQYMVYGLYVAIVTITSPRHNLFYATTVTAKLHGRYWDVSTSDRYTRLITQ